VIWTRTIIEASIVHVFHSALIDLILVLALGPLAQSSLRFVWREVGNVRFLHLKDYLFLLWNKNSFLSDYLPLELIRGHSLLLLEYGLLYHLRLWLFDYQVFLPLFDNDLNRLRWLLLNLLGWFLS
jgi:hypothetical protein